jgi:hypothetical protein
VNKGERVSEIILKKSNYLHKHFVHVYKCYLYTKRRKSTINCENITTPEIKMAAIQTNSVPNHINYTYSTFLPSIPPPYHVDNTYQHPPARNNMQIPVIGNNTTNNVSNYINLLEQSLQIFTKTMHNMDTRIIQMQQSIDYLTKQTQVIISNQHSLPKLPQQQTSVPVVFNTRNSAQYFTDENQHKPAQQQPRLQQAQQPRAQQPRAQQPRAQQPRLQQAHHEHNNLEYNKHNINEHSNSHAHL